MTTKPLDDHSSPLFEPSPLEQISHEQSQQSTQQQNLLSQQQQQDQQSKLIQELMDKHEFLHNQMLEYQKQDKQQPLIQQFKSDILQIDLQVSRILGISLNDKYNCFLDDDFPTFVDEDYPSYEDDSE